MIKYGSVCSGVEAASLAWRHMGWKPVFFSEIEPFPCAVLKHRFPEVPNLGDMTKIKIETMENGDQKFYGDNGTVAVVPGGVDLLVGGTPCQGFSVAGKQGGLNDDRSVLCLTFVRILKEMRPRWFVWENVPGVFSTNDGEDIKAFLRAIDEVGYCCSWRVLDAQYVRVDGFPRAVPQRRRRVFVIGHLGSEWEYPAKVLFEFEGLFGNHPPKRVKGKGFTSDVERSVGTASRPWDGSGVNPTLNQSSAQSGTIRGSNQELFSQNFNGLVQECIGYYPSQHQVPKPCETPTLTTGNCNTVRGDTPLVQERTYYKWHSPALTATEIRDDCAPTILAAMGTGGTSMTTPIFIRESLFDAVGVDQYNMSETGDVTSSLGTNCGMSTGRNAVAVSFEPGIAKRDGGKSRFNEEFSGTLRSNMGDNQTAIAIAETIIGRSVENGGNGIGAQNELAYTQNATGVMGVCTKGNGDAFESDVHTSLSASGGGQAGQGYPCARIASTVRRLLPIECERLMGFPDNWTRIPWKGKPAEECPDSPRYKACGNSMCVNVMRWIGKRIDTITKGETK